jgi:ribosomal protein L7Ae-like RNA K-turn-binding protein
MLQLSKGWPLQESLSQAKEKEEKQEALVVGEKESTKKIKQDERDFFF